MIKDPVLSKIKCYVDWIVCERKFQDQFEVIFGLEQIIHDDVLTYYDLLFEWKSCECMLS
jgi:hypothetical protein